MNFRRSAFRILLLTCFLLLMAWVSLKLMQSGGDYRSLLRELREEYGGYIEGALRFLQEKVLPKAEEIIRSVRAFIEQKLSGG